MSWGVSGHRSEYLKGRSRAKLGLLARNACGIAVRLVSGSDTRWKTGPTGGPRLAVARGAGPPCQRLLRRVGACGAGCSVWATKWAALALGRSNEEKGGRRESRPRGGGKEVGRARDREGERKSFSFLFFQLLLKPF